LTSPVFDLATVISSKRSARAAAGQSQLLQTAVDEDRELDGAQATEVDAFRR
jgi:hypothetical protein